MIGDMRVPLFHLLIIIRYIKERTKMVADKNTVRTEYIYLNDTLSGKQQLGGRMYQSTANYVLLGTT